MTSRKHLGPLTTSIAAMTLLGSVLASPVASAGRREAAPPKHGRQPSSLDSAIAGPGAGRRLGRSLDAVARRNDMTGIELAASLTNDRTLVVANKHLAVIDEAPASTGETATLTAPSSIAAADAFTLHSKPGANKVIYLDVDGHTTSNTPWNSGADIVSDPWDLTGDPTVFDTDERNRIISWWQQVAADFAPWDVDVTTQAPSVDDLVRTSSTDQRYGVRAVISPTNFYSTSTAGVAYLDSFEWNSDTPVFVFTQQLGGGGEKSVGDVSSHELGHAFGLLHDGTNTASYYSGHSDWAPIMGYPMGRSVAQWSKGEYPYANNTEDDIAIIGSMVTAVPDDHADTVDLALNSTASGVIGTSADTDSFKIPGASGPIEVSVTPTASFGALDVTVTVTDPTGAVVATAATRGVGAETVTVPGTADHYIVTVDGAGAGDLVTGYSDYASVGPYSITASGSPIVPPETTAPETTAPETTVPATTEPPSTTTPDTTPETTAPPATTTTTTTPPTTTTTTTTPPTTTTTTAPPTTTTEPPTTTTEPTTTTTVPPVVDKQAHVQWVKIRTTRRHAKAYVKVVDEDGTPIKRVRVYGTWSGGATGARSAKTNSRGIGKTRWVRYWRTAPTFTVTGVRLPDGYAWDGEATSGTGTPRFRTRSRR